MRIAAMGQITTLGADLRSLRKSRGLTLEVLSAQLGKSVGWLSQVERDLSQPDSGDITAIAAALDVPETLFAVRSATTPETGRIVRGDQRRPIGERTPGLVEELLSPDLTDSFEVIYSTFLPGSKRSEPVTRQTQELGVIIAGTLDIWLDHEKFTVGLGDSFRVRDETLRWANPYETPAIAVWVISPPVY